MSTVFDELLSGVKSYLAGFGEEAARSFVNGIDWSMPARRIVPYGLPCLVHLDRVAEIAGEEVRPIVGLLRDHTDQFYWTRTHTGKGFGKKPAGEWGWMELFGARGHFAENLVSGGFLMLGPHFQYPETNSIAESFYIPLTAGAEWRIGDAWRLRAAGEAIHYASNVSHAMRTGEEPLLALYLSGGGPIAARSPARSARM